MSTAAYIDQVFETIKKRNPGEPEFLQAASEVLRSIHTVLDRHPEYKKAKLLERIERRVGFASSGRLWLSRCGGHTRAETVARGLQELAARGALTSAAPPPEQPQEGAGEREPDEGDQQRLETAKRDLGGNERETEGDRHADGGGVRGGGSSLVHAG